MKGIATTFAAAVLLACGCHESHPRGSSSGSNWLTCRTLSDCKTLELAVTCNADGYCADTDGNPIAVDSDGGTTAKISMPQPSDAGAPDPCAWGVDELLRKVGAMAPDRASCGLYNGAETQSVVPAMACFDNLVKAGRAVELTINDCTDCSIPTTYVATTRGEFFAVLMEDDAFGDQLRHARVETCDAIALDPAGLVSCAHPVERYTCQESRSIQRAAAEPLPVTPFKLTDVPSATGAATALLHLYVSNQSFENPLVDINVDIEDTHVITGSFDVGSQHNWSEFDITVPTGMLALHAGSRQGNADLHQKIDVPSERWIVLDYWYSPDDPKGEYFDLTVHDKPVAFD